MSMYSSYFLKTTINNPSPLIQAGVELLKRTGLADQPQVLLNGVPMTPEELDPDVFEESIVTSILEATPNLQRAVYNVSTPSSGMLPVRKEKILAFEIFLS